MLILIMALSVSLVLAGIGVLVLKSRNVTASARSFGYVCFSTSAWVAINQLGINSEVSVGAREWLTYADYALAPIMAASFMIFAVSLKRKKDHGGIKSLVAAVGSILVSMAVILGFVVEVSFNGNTIETEEEFLFYGYIAYIFLVFGIGVFKLFQALKQAVGIEKKQIELIVWSLGLAAVLAVTVNLIIPVVSDSKTYVGLGANATYVSVLLFASMSSYAIARHKLFDVKAAVARVMTYVFTSAVIVGVYAGGVYFLGALVVGLGASSYQVIVNVGLTALLILVYPFIKDTFNKFTNKIFFREAYDAQSFIDDLNKTLVSGVDLDTLLTKSALIIQENMKSSYCTFYIRKTSYLPERVIGAHRGKSDFADIDVISEYAKQLKMKVFDAEAPQEEDSHKKLAHELKKNDASALVRLVDTVDYEVNGIGYIFIGPKRSGGLYSKKDLKILEIIANELVVAVESALRFEEIEQFNVTLQKKIDDATGEIRKSNEKLQALDTAKDEFISMASHQLRTPLTSVKGYISMIMEGDLGEVNDQQKKMLEQAFVSSQRMVYLIADLLNVSRLRTGKFAIEAHPTNLAEVIEGEIDQLKPAAEVRGLKLKYKKPAKFPMLSIDETKIRQVIMNFVDNAIYYTPSGGTITVNLKLTKTSVECTVVDTGMGVPKKEVPHLFTKFYRAGNAKQARPDGTGIGLFMAKKVIVASGGSIVFKTKEGKGSTFGFLLPLSKVRITEDKS